MDTLTSSLFQIAFKLRLIRSSFESLASLLTRYRPLRFFEVFLFEDQPASDRLADHVYLDEVSRCPIYVGPFGQEYGYEDAAVSPGSPILLLRSTPVSSSIWSAPDDSAPGPLTPLPAPMRLSPTSRKIFHWRGFGTAFTYLRLAGFVFG